MTERIRYDWARVSCPTCGAGQDERCRTLTTGRTTDAHQRRHDMANRLAYERRIARLEVS